MIDLILLTGFLGAGKTTLMQRLLAYYKDKKIGILVNDCGEADIDAALLARDGIRMTALKNGSIFCACIKDKFVRSLIELSALPIDLLLIEASGLADPAGMTNILAAVAPQTKNAFHYLGSICLADAESFTELCQTLPALPHQVAYSGVVILNKTDLADSETLAAAKELIAKLNPTAAVFPSRYCNAELAAVTQALVAPALAPDESTNTEQNKPQTFLLTVRPGIGKQALGAFLDEIAPHAFRIKGFAKTDTGCFYISAAGHHVQFTPWEGKDVGGEIVVISAVGLRMMTLLTQALGKLPAGAIRLHA